MTKEQIEDLFRLVIIEILQLSKDDNKTVRFPYGSSPKTGSAPGFERKDILCFVNVSPGADPYAEQQHYSVRDDGGDNLTLVDEHTNSVTVTFSCYGSLSDEWAKKIRLSMTKPHIKKLLKDNGFFFVSGMKQMKPLYEKVNGEWWRRCDYAADFYQYERLEDAGSIGTIEKVNITPIIETEGKDET